MTKSQQNLSPSTAYARFMLGSVLTAYGTVKLLREPKSRSGKMLVLFGSMKVAEGATKFCPRKAASSMMDKMMSENTSQSASAGALASMSSATGSQQNASNSSTGQMGGNLMQMVGNIVQKLAGTNASQQMTSGTTAQTIGNIAQTVAPKVGQMMNDVASMTGSQNATGANNVAKQASSTSGASNKTTTTNANANTQNAANGSSNEKKNASATNNSVKKQATSTNSNNMPKTDATKPPGDSAAKNSTVDASVIDAVSKTAAKNTTTTDILH